MRRPADSCRRCRRAWRRPPAFAHHSFGATYEITKAIKLEGKIVQFVYRNPHSFVHVEAPDAERRLAAMGGRVGRHRAARAGRREARHAEGRRQGRHQSGVRRACPASTAC